MYEVREKWIKTYTKKYFAVRMITTSTSEGINSFMAEYVNAKMIMKEFVVNSEKHLLKNNSSKREKSIM